MGMLLNGPQYIKIRVFLHVEKKLDPIKVFKVSLSYWIFIYGTSHLRQGK